MNSYSNTPDMQQEGSNSRIRAPRSARLRVPLLAALAGVGLYLSLLFVTIGVGFLSGSSPYVDIIFRAGNAHAAALAQDGEDEGDDDDDSGPGDDDELRWEGTIISLPPTLIGVWTIATSEDEQISVVATAATKFDPETRLGYAVGSWVEVRAIEAGNGTYTAERIRIEEYEDGEIIVRLKSAKFVDAIVDEFDLTLKSTVLSSANIYLFTTEEGMEPDLVARIAGKPNVIWAEVNYINSVPEDDGYKTWGWGGIEEPHAYVNQHAFEQIHWSSRERNYDGDGVVVAVLDTGIYTSHEQFAGKLQLPSLDVISDDNDPSDEGPGLAWGHGTHVAGVITAMAPRAKILPVRVLDSNGRGNTFLLAYAIEWVTQQPGVQVINLSLGTEFDSMILRDAVRRATQQGIVVVAAAGNNSTNLLQFPAAYPNVIAVTAVDGESHKANFANYGREWVDLAAPGVGIMSTMISEEGAGYASWSGTSMSTAFVSGAAVLMADQANGRVATLRSLLGLLMETGGVLDVLNPLFAGQIGRLLDVSAALGVKGVGDRPLLFIPFAEKSE